MNDTPPHAPVRLAAVLDDSAPLGFALSCEPRTGALLATLAASKPGGRLLELGTGTGVGAAWLLDGMDANARLISVDLDPTVQTVARTHLGSDPRVTFETSDADAWLSGYQGEPFDLVFVDCRPGKFHALDRVLGLLRPGGLYVADDLLPQPTWPEGHQERVDAFLDRLPHISELRIITLAWSSGLVVGARS